MTQNTLNDEIEKQFDKTFYQVGKAIKCKADKLPITRIELERFARSIAEKTVEAVRVEKDVAYKSAGNGDNLEGWNEAVTEQSKKAKEWLGE